MTTATSDAYSIERAHQNGLRNVLITRAQKVPCIEHPGRHGEPTYDHCTEVEATVLIDHLMPIINLYVETHYQPRSLTA